MKLERLQILITGLVQGVGFRPHVYQLASLHELSGWVQNISTGVLIEIQGVATASFLTNLTDSCPPLARIDSIQTKNVPLIHDENAFKIIQSHSGESRTMISPDVSICDDCLDELFDPQSRYYHYPFLNCTQCGPRLTITRNLPYDREQTSMNTFVMCSACHDDYQNPDNRRYHAQPTACTNCGPQLSSNIEVIAQAIRDGKIIALKGLGGYQLICDARNDKAIDTLRQRKQRKAKPFALMIANIDSASSIVKINDKERQLLMSPARPIVLLEQCDETLPKSLAPNLSHLGIMLPSTPLHYLLFNELKKMQVSILVVTSANLGGEPLLIDDIDAKEKLVSIADLTVSYNRQILTRVDDSVMQIMNHATMFIRRARGFAPQRIKLPYSIPSTLALGGHLKNTFCITRDDEAFVSQHLGSLTNKSTIEFFHESLTHWLEILDANIERVACDLHPDFYTTQFAHNYNLPVIAVQHHHAHLASAACEHHILEPALGLALDGFGYGLDGTAWGGELMLFDNNHFQRLGSLLPLPAPGGDIAVREPWRMAASILQKLNLNHCIVERFAAQTQALNLANLLKTNVSAMPLTSSCGRLFDAASALLDINHISSYEGQAALQLESLVTELVVLPNGWYVDNEQFNLLPTFQYLLDVNPVIGANVFHGTLIAGLTAWLAETATKVSTNVIVLSGGCFLNKVLTEGLYRGLTQRGFKVYLPVQLPPNDGGLSLGQAWVAGTKETLLCV